MTFAVLPALLGLTAERRRLCHACPHLPGLGIPKASKKAGGCRHRGHAQGLGAAFLTLGAIPT
ncbi:hypothetical protein [Nonomuraea turcica]|uniref:hypothetical protein n=1 Tax=Nonomuraea sp. G32 TaxID=3067274 RepID=UPI00273B5642|nr:hypothetical protein [Nonomuraea sp. G32]MDP4502620.1 hypothetical protein [Nonomuraea sp. G32]